MLDSTAADLPLYGVTVVDFGQYIAAPGATQTLADPGAEVIKVETGIMSVTGEADGDPQRVGFPVVDHATSYVVAQAILAALLARPERDAGYVADRHACS